MKQKPTKKCENGVQLRPASIEEAGLFYSEPVSYTHLVKKLRAKLGDCGSMISTVRGYGYRFEG